MSDSPVQKHVHPDDLAAFCADACRRCGMKEEHAALTALVLATTDAWGIHTHGTKSLRQYLNRVRQGGVNKLAEPTVVREGPAWAIVDAQHTMGMVGACAGMEAAIARAKVAGVGYAGVMNGTHFGAASYYAHMALEHDMIGLSMANSDPTMTIPGAKGHQIGNNPLAFAAPAGKEKPILLDIAMSTVAGGKVVAALMTGKPIPPDWLVDEQGQPTTDGSLYPRKAFVVPMARHKGYGLAVMIETLTAALTGAQFLLDVKSWMVDEPTNPTGQGYAFVAIDIGAIMPLEQFKQRMDRMIRELKNAPKAEGSERVYLPGEMEWERREAALRCGISLPADVLESLRGMAEDCAMALPPWLTQHDR